MEIDTQRHIVRAIAVGTTELRSKDLTKKLLTREEILNITAENLSAEVSQLRIAAENGFVYAVTMDHVEKKLFGLVKKVTHPLRLIDEEGVIRLQKNNAMIRQSSIADWKKDTAFLLEELTEYNDGGTNLPNFYIVLNKKVIDLSGMSAADQIYSLAEVELAGYEAEMPLILAATNRTDT